MKGTLHKTEQGWYVSHATYDMTSKRWTAGKFPVHPDDLDSEVIRWANNGSLDNNKVEFEIKYYWDGIMEQPIEVAKLIKPEYPELEGTMNLCNDIIEKRTGKMTEEEWQAAERAQTSKTKLMTSIEWLENELKKSIHYYRLIEDIESKSTIVQSNIFEQAKEMHKQEIMNAYFEGAYGGGSIDKEKYYQETFVSKGSGDTLKH